MGEREYKMLGPNKIAIHSEDERKQYAIKYSSVFAEGYVPTDEDIEVHNSWVDAKIESKKATS